MRAKNKVDLTTNNFFVRSGLISWQEVNPPPPPPPREASTALSTFSGEEQEEEGKTSMYADK